MYFTTEILWDGQVRGTLQIYGSVRTASLIGKHEESEKAINPFIHSIPVLGP